MPMTDEQIAKLYDKHFTAAGQVKPIDAEHAAWERVRQDTNDMQRTARRFSSDRPAPVKAARLYREQLVAAGYATEQADAFECLLSAHARRMAPMFGETPAEYLERRMAGFFGMTPEEFEGLRMSPEADGNIYGTLYQAAMSRAPDASVSEFARRVSSTKETKKTYFEVESEHGVLAGQSVILPADSVRHRNKRHPDMTDQDMDRLPQVLNSLSPEQVRLPKKDVPRFAGKGILAWTVVDGQPYGLALESVSPDRVIVGSYFKDTENGVKAWFEQQGDAKKAAVTPAALWPAQAPSSDGNAFHSQPSSEIIIPDAGIKGKRFDQFAGENSRMSESVRANLAKARELAATGTGNEDIRRQTDWFRGMDGKWRYEIPDNTDKLDFYAYGVKGETLGDIYENPELYRAYPELAGIRVDIQAGREDYSGTFDRTENKIILYGVSINDFETAKRTLLHEIQHVIQDIENFGIGANLKMFRLRLAPNVERLQNELLGRLPQNSCLQDVVKSINAASLERQMADYGTEETILLTDVAAARRDEFASELDLAQRLPGKLGITPEQAQEYSQLFNRFIAEFEFSALLTPATQYLLTAGEIEARDAASRSSLSDEERAAKAPGLRDDAIVTFGREQVASFSLEQQKSRGPRGAIRQLDDGRWLVGLFRNRDASTIIHETGHFFMEQLREAAGLADAPEWVGDSWAKLQKVYGFEGFPTGEAWTKAQERFATDFEAYMREGKAPSYELQGAFEQFRKWLTDIYRTLKELLGENELDPEVREVFDRLLINENRITVPQTNNNIVHPAALEKTTTTPARESTGRGR